MRTALESSTTSVLFEIDAYRKLMSASKARGVKLRYVTEITAANAEKCKRMIDEFSVEMRHLDGLKGNFFVTESEFIAASREITQGQLVRELIYSSQPEIVERNEYLFEMLWDRAIPADIRLVELSKGEQLGDTKLTFSTREIFESANRFINEMEEEALVIVSREGSIKGNLEFFQKLVQKASLTGAAVKILGRFSRDETALMNEFHLAGVQVRTLAPGHISNLALGIYDRKGMGLVQYIFANPERDSSGQTYLTGVISTSKQTVAGIAAIFDSLWEETQVRQRAELLQDILSHDIRNYNQIVSISAEMLKDDVTSADERNSGRRNPEGDSRFERPYR